MTSYSRPWQTDRPAAAETGGSSQAASGAGTAERFLFFGRVIESLASGHALRNWATRLLKAAAAGAAFTGLFLLFDAWQFASRHEAAGVLGGIVYMLFLAAGVYMVVHATIIRTGHIASLGQGEFTLIPLCAVLALLVGEAYAAFSASVSLGGGILIWFTGGDAFRLLGKVSAFVPAQDGTDFLAGILFIVKGLARAAALLAAAYLASELFLVVEKVAQGQVTRAADQP